MAVYCWQGGSRRLVSDLLGLVAERAPAETELPARHAAVAAAAEKQYAAASSEAEARYQAQRARLEDQYASARRDIEARCDAELAAAEQRYRELCRQIAAADDAAQQSEAKRLQDAQWEAATVLEAARKGLDTQRKDALAHVDAEQRQLAMIRQQAVGALKRRGLWQGAWETATTASAPACRLGSPAEQLAQSLDSARQILGQLLNHRAGRLFEGAGLFGMISLVALGAFSVSALLLSTSGWLWIAAGAAGTTGVSIGLGTALFHSARRHSEKLWSQLAQALAEADAACQAVRQATEAHWQQQVIAAQARMEQQCKAASDGFARAAGESSRQRAEAMAKAKAEHAARTAQIATQRQEALAQAEARFVPLLDALRAAYEAEAAQAREAYQRQREENDRHFQEAWEAMARRWREGLERFRQELSTLEASCARLFPAWDSPAWNAWVPPAAFPPGVAFGRFEVDLEAVEGGLPGDPTLRPPQTHFGLPALFPFGDQSVLLWKAVGEGRNVAIQNMQAVLLRMLTAIPPGKVRFLIVDPIGLGENFSAFMHLADYHEQLVASRIWTEPPHIEQRLAELTEHMENILQVYLRNEFGTIQQYNAMAGEMSQPYRVLVVANFPAGFTEASARRLLSIAASGSRCGVYCLVSVDMRLRPPRDFQLADLERHAVRLRWQGGRFAWEDPDLARFPLDLECPPPAEQFTQIVRRVGAQIKDVDRVEVPFATVAPDEDQWWTADSASGLEVPLGRAGATKLQYLRLGTGTSQHVLIAGKTGSGKSTLLHVLVTNLAMRYGPDQVELYLVDFKKGVEFKAYAQSRLPHARVIAIESEREFGLSVLERLDAELKRRGDLFRGAGVQDLPAFRAAHPGVRLPRVLLIIDEFQELFVEDDRVAQSAALLLDRLVRQGRAFGIHVCLGSQTLAGAYSLPRSTMGQMAVRIALQCSEADAHLILSEENTAARLLSRPGEAIYNDANGLYEGNHPFQVVWLPDEAREQYLERIGQHAVHRDQAGAPPVVFEGNTAAELGENPMLAGLLALDHWPAPPAAPKAWLGAAVAIKEPTAVELARQSAQNVLVVGYQAESALGVLASAVISLAAQHAPGASGRGRVRFCILDGSRGEGPHADFWPRLAASLVHEVRVVLPREAAQVIGALAEEVAHREQAADPAYPPVFLVVYDLARFRDLRRAEDELGFLARQSDAPSSPAEQFATILRGGPAVGVHTLLWCDTYHNAVRWLDRTGLRELEMRVLFQVNANDSSNLIDSPLASQLGMYRAVLYHEVDGRLEKFRPYGVPPADWLARLAEQFRRRP